jgi:hypothetical protein
MITLRYHIFKSHEALKKSLYIFNVIHDGQTFQASGLKILTL